MRRFVLPLFAAAAVASPAAAVSAAEVQIASAGPIVELTVTESVEAEPDLVQVGAGVTTDAPTAVEAMRLNAQAMSAVVERIGGFGVAERDIQTTGISLGARYDYDQVTQRQVFRGYQASNRVSIRLRELKRTGQVLDALVAAGATDLTGPEFTVEDNSGAKAQARAAAIKTLREQALSYARLAGYRDVRLLRIEEGQAVQPPRPMMRMAAESASDASTPVQPGLIEAGVTITVTYELVPEGGSPE
jgi:uncharacterized protein YggE